MDIGSNSSGVASRLSNFTFRKFIIDTVECNSMEGFLQALKFENIESQKYTCSLVGFMAKKKGRGRNKYWQTKQCLWWNEVEYRRDSREYGVLLDRAYNALYECNESFRNDLKQSGDAIFRHSIGRNKITETVLTESEFCRRLQYLKDFGLIPIKE